jgi:hypothetical protein
MGWGKLSIDLTGKCILYTKTSDTHLCKNTSFYLRKVIATPNSSKKILATFKRLLENLQTKQQEFNTLIHADQVSITNEYVVEEKVSIKPQKKADLLRRQQIIDKRNSIQRKVKAILGGSNRSAQDEKIELVGLIDVLGMMEVMCHLNAEELELPNSEISIEENSISCEVRLLGIINELARLIKRIPRSFASG